MKCKIWKGARKLFVFSVFLEITFKIETQDKTSSEWARSLELRQFFLIYKHNKI
jgi:hypothetical protein